MAAKKGNKNAVGNNGGAPSRYRKEYAEQAYKISLLGATDKELADFFEVREQTINNWKKKHPEFAASIKKGKTLADGNVVERLYQRAIGYQFQEVTFEKVDSKAALESAANDTITCDAYKKRIVVKELPPETMAAIYWLNNRQKLNWKQKQTMTHEFNPEDLNDDQLDKVIEGLKHSLK